MSTETQGNFRKTEMDRRLSSAHWLTPPRAGEAPLIDTYLNHPSTILYYSEVSTKAIRHQQNKVTVFP